MKSTDLEFLTTGICPAQCIRLSPECLGTADVLRLARFHQTECLPPSR